MPAIQEWLKCNGLPVEKCNRYRKRRGLPPISNATTTPPVHENQPQFRGLGDVVDAVTTVTGIKAVVKAVEKVTGRPCGCEKRRQQLNEAVPFHATTRANP